MKDLDSQLLSEIASNIINGDYALRADLFAHDFENFKAELHRQFPRLDFTVEDYDYREYNEKYVKDIMFGDISIYIDSDYPEQLRNQLYSLDNFKKLSDIETSEVGLTVYINEIEVPVRNREIYYRVVTDMLSVLYERTFI